MHPLIQALFSAWEWRPELLAILFLFGTLYIRGWMHLRKQRGKQSKLANYKRLVSYCSGLVFLAIALMSPIDLLGGQLFFMHMIQHLLTIMIAAPLLWLANPFPIILWGLPVSIRKPITGLFAPHSRFRYLLSKATSPAVAWFAFIISYIGWHDANLYNLALRRAWVHDLEHVMFFGSAMLFWWHVIGAGPRIHGHFPGWGRFAYVLSVIPPNMLTGVAICFASAPIYTYYESIPRFWGFTVMEDQKLGGVIMWIPGSMMFVIAGLLVLAVLLQEAEKNPPKSAIDWQDDETLIAPGLEHRIAQNKERKLGAT